jgi:hypothetical protein
MANVLEIIRQAIHPNPAGDANPSQRFGFVLTARLKANPRDRDNRNAMLERLRKTHIFRA